MVDIVSSAISRRTWDMGGRMDQETYEKWPVWARLFVIIGLSALLWGGIISAAIALFG